MAKKLAKGLLSLSINSKYSLQHAVETLINN